MSSVAEIEAVLPKLSIDELQKIELALLRQYRERHGQIIYDDSHGVETEADLISAANQAFLEYDKAEKANEQSQPR